MMDYEYDIEKLLEEGHIIQVNPQGYSMYPLWKPGDSIIIGPIAGKKPKRGEVVLFRRVDSILVIHRIHHITNDDYYLLGDNQTLIEGPVAYDNIKGILLEIIRNGRHISVKNPIYLFLTGLWLAIRPLRPALSSFVHKLKIVFGR